MVENEVGLNGRLLIMTKCNWKVKTVFLILVNVLSVTAQQTLDREAISIARLKYSGGGDWYNDPSCIPNLAAFFEEQTGSRCNRDEVRLALSDEALFSQPFLFMTGHGRIFFSEKEAEQLRRYLENGGFLFADDDYGMNDHFAAK